MKNFGWTGPKWFLPFHGNQQIFRTQEQNKFSTPFNLFFVNAMFALCRIRIENSFLVKEAEKLTTSTRKLFGQEISFAQSLVGNIS